LYISDMSFLRPLATSVFAASLISLSACGGSSSSTPAYTVPADAGLVVKAVPTIRWDATEYTATAGDIKVFLANDDSVKHILVVLQDDKVVGDLELTVTKKGTVDEGTINLEAGVYSVYCTIPGHGNMNSTLTVS
jgi:plastocyanin